MASQHLPVALKVLHHHQATSPETRQRFVREARAAHCAGIIHRDLKPENAMLVKGPDGREHVKVVDFGLALLVDSPGVSRITAEGVAAGTPAYMSPEQCQGSAVDARSDLYSLGIMTYELLCGVVPYQADSSTGVLMKHLLEKPSRPSERRPDLVVPPALEAAALHAMEKRPSLRPDTAASYAESLREALRGPGAVRKRGELGDRSERRARAGLDDARVSLAAEPASELGLVLIVDDGSNDLQAVAARADLVCALFESVRSAPMDLPGVAALVVDIRRSPDARLAAITTLLAEQPGAPVIVVGPSGALDVMASALRAGVADYIPAAELDAKLLTSVTRVVKRARRRR